jgi:DNA-binding response OmpR family regulator
VEKKLSKRILVIDDEEAVRKSFILALEDTDYQVETVESGEKGFERVQTNKYDLVFLDLKMPRMNGVETLRELRKIDESVPVYIVTAFHKEFFEQLEGVVEDGIGFEIAKKPLSSNSIVLITKGILEGPQSF